MDNFDRQILSLLQTNSHVSSEQIGVHVGLSATACQRRIKKLRQSGVIEKSVAVLNGTAFGGYVTVIVDVIMKQGGNLVKDNFINLMLSHNAVQQCYYVTGHVDFVVVIIAKNMLEYEKITQTLFLDDPNINKFNSNVVMQNVKVGLDIPIE